jgi:hypothetical protein
MQAHTKHGKPSANGAVKLAANINNINKASLLNQSKILVTAKAAKNVESLPESLDK